MSQKVKTLLIDDLILYNTDGKEEEQADETVDFALDGKRYRIDLTDLNAEELRDLMQPYVNAASQKIPFTRQASRTTAHRQRSAEIRAWARKHKIAVSERGRIPADVVRQYDAAH